MTPRFGKSLKQPGTVSTMRSGALMSFSVTCRETEKYRHVWRLPPRKLFRSAKEGGSGRILAPSVFLDSFIYA